MLKKTMQTVDFGGTERTETYYFNLTKAEIMEMQLGTEGGFVEMIHRIVDAKSQLELTEMFKKIICKSYGSSRIRPCWTTSWPHRPSVTCTWSWSATIARPPHSSKASCPKT